MFELPTCLTQCLKSKSYAQAVHYYSRTSRLLTHYKHLSVFSGIQAECKEIIEKITKNIWQKMLEETVNGAEITECISLLIELKESNLLLWKEYIKS